MGGEKRAQKSCGEEFISRVHFKRSNRYKTFDTCKACWQSTQTWAICGQAGHLRIACPSKNSSGSTGKTGKRTATTPDQAQGTADSTGFLFTVKENRADKAPPATKTADNSASLPNLEWMNGQFVKQPPRRQPHLDVTISVMHDSQASLGFGLSSAVRNGIRSKVHVTALADTGAQSCSSGPGLLTALGYPEKHLMKTRHAISGVAGNNLDILGALLVEIAVNGRLAKCMMYICRNEPSTILSEQTLIDLGIVKRTFPSTTPASVQVHSAATGVPLPTSLFPPELPKSIPFAPTEENRESLESWIKRRYAASAFNTSTTRAPAPTDYDRQAPRHRLQGRRRASGGPHPSPCAPPLES